MGFKLEDVKIEGDFFKQKIIREYELTNKSILIGDRTFAALLDFCDCNNECRCDEHVNCNCDDYCTCDTECQSYNPNTGERRTSKEDPYGGFSD